MVHAAPYCVLTTGYGIVMAAPRASFVTECTGVVTGCVTPVRMTCSAVVVRELR